LTLILLEIPEKLNFSLNAKPCALKILPSLKQNTTGSFTNKILWPAPFSPVELIQDCHFVQPNLIKMFCHNLNKFLIFVKSGFYRLFPTPDSALLVQRSNCKSSIIAIANCKNL
jgi:hypothetical protein